MTAPALPPTPVATTPADSPCTKSAKTIIFNIMKAALDKGGEALYNALSSTYNTFIDLIEQEANAVIAVLEPILSIDKFIFDNFIKPPLDSVITLAATVQQTIKIPAQTIGATSGACQPESNNAGAVKKIEAFLTQDLDHLKNKLDNYNYQGVISQQTLDALKTLPAYMEKLRLPAYSVFKGDVAALAAAMGI